MLYIPFHYNKIYEGGVKTFMFNLQNYLDSVGFKYTTDQTKATSIFFPNLIFEKNIIAKVKASGGKVIQRLDGVHHPSMKDNKYVADDENIKDIYLNYSDFIVFQSDYSRRQCFEMYGVKPESDYRIVINGVDKKIFFPNKSSKSHDKIIFITTGNLRSRVMLEAGIQALDSLKGKFDFEYHVVGKVDPSLQDLLNRDYIKYLGAGDLEKVADSLRNADIYLHCNINDPCPNSILEAISTGLPVVGFETGSMPELCFFSKDLLAFVSDKLFHVPEDLDYKALASKIVYLVDHFEKYKEIALQNASLYSFEECGAKYVQIFNSIISSIKKQNMLTKVKRVAKKFLPNNETYRKTLLQKSPEELRDYLAELVKEKVELLSPTDGLKFILDLDNKLYLLEGWASMRYGGGTHTKHRHIKYHDFFAKNIESGETVLDIGSSVGELTSDIAKKANPGLVVGIEIEEDKFRKAVETYQMPNLKFVHGDATKDLPDQKFDVITLSNVLEHIEKRPELLTILREKYSPKRFIIRVPLFERDWRVPIKKELGLDYRLDDTHFIEYTLETFSEEMEQAGLKIKHLEVRWGEIWAVLEAK